MDKHRAQEILTRYLNGTATNEEKELVESYYNIVSKKKGQLEEQQIISILRRKEKGWDSLLSKTDTSSVTPNIKRTSIIRYIKIAAVAVGISTIGAVFYAKFIGSHQVGIINGQKKIVQTNNINKAKLLLPEGTELLLDSTQNRLVVHPSGMMTYGSGEQAFVASSSQMGARFKIRTQKAGLYHIQLTDGSEISLNSESSLTFPLRFDQRDRDVHLIGEAFFSITKSPNQDASLKPFSVYTNSQHIRVLGTKFNVKAYSREQREVVTLVEGRVEVRSKDRGADKVVLLKPNEEVTYAEPKLMLSKTEVTNKVEWKSGNFVFQDEKLKDVLEKVAHWYNIELDYKVNVSDIQLIGIIPRSNSLPVTLEQLSRVSGIKFKLEGRRVVIMK